MTANGMRLSNFGGLREVELLTRKQLKAGAETQHTAKPPNADRRVLWLSAFFIISNY